VDDDSASQPADGAGADEERAVSRRLDVATVVAVAVMLYRYREYST
jgi:hypothetical protein